MLYVIIKKKTRFFPFYRCIYSFSVWKSCVIFLKRSMNILSHEVFMWANLALAQIPGLIYWFIKNNFSSNVLDVTCVLWVLHFRNFAQNKLRLFVLFILFSKIIAFRYARVVLFFFYFLLKTLLLLIICPCYTYTTQLNSIKLYFVSVLMKCCVRSIYLYIYHLKKIISEGYLSFPYICFPFGVASSILLNKNQQIIDDIC